MNKKIIIIINGSGGVGKDTLCSYAETKYSVRNISSVDPIKEIAKVGGWKGEKDDNARSLLVNLKKAFVNYNDLPLKYMLEQYNFFMQGSEEIFFVHIREPKEIDKFRNSINSKYCKTLLVTKETSIIWNNSSDMGVYDYNYDYYFDNSLPLEESVMLFIELLSNIFNSVYDE